MNEKITDTTKVAQIVREQLKKEFPACKFSVTSKYFSGGSELTISLMSAPFEVFKDNLVHSQMWEPQPRKEAHTQLNHNTLYKSYEDASGLCNGAFLTVEAWEVLQRAVKIGQANNWDNSDIQTDYFDVNYYFDIQIGKWNKEFEVK